MNVEGGIDLRKVLALDGAGVGSRMFQSGCEMDGWIRDSVAELGTLLTLAYPVSSSRKKKMD